MEKFKTIKSSTILFNKAPLQFGLMYTVSQINEIINNGELDKYPGEKFAIHRQLLDLDKDVGIIIPAKVNDDYFKGLKINPSGHINGVKMLSGIGITTAMANYLYDLRLVKLEGVVYKLDWDVFRTLSKETLKGVENILSMLSGVENWLFKVALYNPDSCFIYDTKENNMQGYATIYVNNDADLPVNKIINKDALLHIIEFCKNPNTKYLLKRQLDDNQNHNLFKLVKYGKVNVKGLKFCKGNPRVLCIYDDIVDVMMRHHIVNDYFGKLYIDYEVLTTTDPAIVDDIEELIKDRYDVDDFFFRMALINQTQVFIDKKIIRPFGKILAAIENHNYEEYNKYTEVYPDVVYNSLELIVAAFHSKNRLVFQDLVLGYTKPKLLKELKTRFPETFKELKETSIEDALAAKNGPQPLRNFMLMFNRESVSAEQSTIHDIYN